MRSTKQDVEDISPILISEWLWIKLEEKPDVIRTEQESILRD